LKSSKKKNRQENQKKEEAITPDYPACSHVTQLQIGGMEGIAHVPSKNKSALVDLVFFFQEKNLRRTLLMTNRPYVEAPRISDMDTDFLFELRSNLIYKRMLIYY